MLRVVSYLCNSLHTLGGMRTPFLPSPTLGEGQGEGGSAPLNSPHLAN